MREKTQTMMIERKLTLQEKKCPVCSKVFWGAKVRKFCSLACAQKDSYQRHAEERRSARMAKYRAEKTASARKK